MRIASHFPSRLRNPSLIAVIMVASTVCGSITAHAQSFFVNETADGSANIRGFYSSLALDALGNPHVCYQDDSVDDLMYARKSGGAWTIETADAFAFGVGDYASLALDAQGNPHACYRSFPTDVFRYARKSGGSWTTEERFAGGVVADLSLALDAQGNPQVTLATNVIRYFSKSGGVWSLETVEGVSSSNVALALDVQGNPHVCYNTDGTTDLKHAWKSGSVWTVETADGSANDVGRECSIALDVQGNAHVSYQDNTLGDLKYARKTGGDFWVIETVDGSANVVGFYTSIALDAQGNPHISYLDNTRIELKYARKSGGVWTIQTAHGTENRVGYYTSLALDAQGNPHISYLDDTSDDLKYATAAVRVAGPIGGATWAVGSLQNVAWTGIGPVDILISADGGSTFERRETGVTKSPWSLRVPHIPTRFAKVRIERATPLSTSESDSFFTIDATIALAKFDATHSDDGTRLTWETNPGPEADIRYRIERGTDGAFVSIAGGLDRGEFLDQSAIASSRYRLIAINGLGEEYVLGETSVASALAAGRWLAVYPNPATAGEVGITFRVPFDAEHGASGAPIDLSVYDVSGRHLRTVVSGVYTTGVGTARWDGRRDDGEPVAAGVYFLRLSSRARVEATERVVVVR